MGQKWGIFGGFGREKRGRKGEFRAPEAGKKALFYVPEGWLAGTEGFSAQNRTLCPKPLPPRKSPWG